MNHLPIADPEDVGFRAEGLAEVDRLLERYRAEGAFPGAVAAVGKAGAIAYLRPFGRLSRDPDAPPVETDTIYDLASLTKVLVTATMAMVLVDRGDLDLGRSVASLLPGFESRTWEDVRVWHLLTHSSGLPSWAPFYRDTTGREAYLQRIAATPLSCEPGSRSEYSDLGFILLGAVLERAAGEGLGVFAGRAIFGPLGMKDTLYRPGPELLPRIAPTERDPWRGRLLRGEVHDENAFAMGGVAGHAGVFGTAADLASFAQMILDGGAHDGRRIFSAETLARFTHRAEVPGSSRALGWDTPAPGSSAGSLLSPESVGHTGFTGTSLWIDRDRDRIMVLLTNRVHPCAAPTMIQRIRGDFHRAALQEAPVAR